MSSEAIVRISTIIISLIGAIITYIVVPYIRSKTSAEQRQNIYNLVRITVQAAEQMYDAGLITIPKKEYVVNYLQSKGINLSEDDLDVMIEAAVRELNIIQAKVLE